MPQSNPLTKARVRPGKSIQASKGESRHTVAFTPQLAGQVARYARANDSSVSKAIATLVRIGLEGQEQRKREFFKKLKSNLANDDPRQQDQLIDDFRSLILGR
jgi:hypothetical protein